MILTAVQKKETMDLLCQKLFDQRLVRGIRQIPTVHTFYEQGKKKQNEEILLLMEIKDSDYKKIEELIKEFTDFSIPEITLYKIKEGNLEYFQAIKKETEKIETM